MSVIIKLREKYAKLTGGVVVVALLGFILMDFGRSGPMGSTTVGKIDGQKIDVQEYEALINQSQNYARQQNQGNPLTSEQDAQLRDQVWQQMVSKHVLDKLNEDLGLTITEAELNNLLTGTNPDQAVVQNFTNPQTGEFNPQEVAAQIQQIKNDPNQKEAWAGFIEDIKARNLEQKIVSLLAGGLYVPKFVLKDQTDGMSEVASGSFVKIPYTSIADNDAKVTDAEIKTYIQNNRKRFKVDKTTRNIRYVSFNVLPSSIDSSLVLDALDTLKRLFAEEEDAQSFVNHHSQNAIAPMYYPEQRLNLLANAAEVKEAEVNSVIGPFYNNGNYELVKILGKKVLPDTVYSRHILVAITQGDQIAHSEEEAKAKIDSAILELHSGASFLEVAQKYSEDPNSVDGGEMGLEFTLMQKPNLEDVYGQEYSDFIFNALPGESKLIKVELDNYTAYNYVQVANRSQPTQAIKLAFITRELTANEDTYNAFYHQASNFATGLMDGKKSFDEMAQEMSVFPNNAEGIDANSYLINGLGSSSDIVKWTYDKNTKMGDVSPIFSVGENYIVAQLKGVQNEGLLEITDQNRPMLQAEVMKEKKAKMIKDKYQDVGNSLEAFATKTGQEVGTVQEARFAQSFDPALGNEPKVIGYFFNSDFKPNTVSKGIAGNDGVFYISLNARNKEAVPEYFGSEQEMKSRIISGLKQDAPQMLLQSLIEKASVKDQRAKVYN